MHYCVFFSCKIQYDDSDNGVSAYKSFLKGANIDLNDPKNIKIKKKITQNSQDGVYIYNGRFYYKGKLANGFFDFTVTDDGDTCIPMNILDGIEVYLFNNEGQILNVATAEPANYSFLETEDNKVENGKLYERTETDTEEYWSTMFGESPMDTDFGNMEDGVFTAFMNKNSEFILVPYFEPTEDELQEDITKIYFNHETSNVIKK